MHAAFKQGIEIDRQGSDQRLALAGLHLGDLALVQDHATNELHVEMALPQRALGGLAHGGEGFRQQIVKAGTFLEAGLEFIGLGAQGLVRELFELRLKGVDLFDFLAIGAQLALIGVAKDLLGKGA